MVALALARPRGREGAEHDAFKRRAVLGRTDQLAGAGWCQTMGCQ
jgi:hypothetical protein